MVVCAARVALVGRMGVIFMAIMSGVDGQAGWESGLVVMGLVTGGILKVR